VPFLLSSSRSSMKLKISPLKVIQSAPYHTAWLMTARNIDDAEPVVGQTNGPICVRAVRRAA